MEHADPITILEFVMKPIETHTDLIPEAVTDGQTLIARVRGEIDLHNSPDLRDALLSLITDQGSKKLVINLQGVPYMDSSAIAVLVELLQRLRKDGGAINLTNLQPRVKGLMEIARLDRIFKVADTEEDALK